MFGISDGLKAEINKKLINLDIMSIDSEDAKYEVTFWDGVNYIVPKKIRVFVKNMLDAMVIKNNLNEVNYLLKEHGKRVKFKKVEINNI